MPLVAFCRPPHPLDSGDGRHFIYFVWKMNAKDIQKIICKAETMKRNFCCENVKYLFNVGWEYDVASLNGNGYLTDFEVKISRSDFKADAKKKKIRYYIDPLFYRIPNYFYYVVPDGLVKREEIPNFAGLIFVVGDALKTIKRAPFLHKTIHNREIIVAKFCRVMQERLHLGKCYLTIKNEQIREYNERLESSVVLPQRAVDTPLPLFNL
jgi:hypothetical protein